MYQELNFKKEPFETYFEFNDKFESIFEAEALNEKLADLEWEAGVDRNSREYIRWVQDSLNRLMNLRLPVTGIMDAAVRSALRSFQEKRGLPADGVAGPGTKRALAEARSRRSVFGGDRLQSETFEALYDESAGQFEFADSGTSTIQPASSYTTPTLDSMACRLLCASYLAYASAHPLGSPYTKAVDLLYYTKAGFLEPPTVIPGKKKIDACLIGTMNGPAPAQKSVVLAFRGTAGATWADWVNDWLNDFEAVLVPFTKSPTVLVHKGFNDSVESFFGKDIVKNIKDRLNANRGAQLYITGHSKGGALAHLAALLLRTKHPEIPVAGVISFEALRPGHPSFVKAYNATGINSLRYEFQNDVVPYLPPSDTDRFASALLANIPASVQALLKHFLTTALRLFIPITAPKYTYAHVGKLRFIDWSGKIRDDDPGLQAQRIDKLLTIVRGAVVKAAGMIPFAGIAGASVSLSADIYKQILSHHPAGCGWESWRVIWAKDCQASEKCPPEK